MARPPTDYSNGGRCFIDEARIEQTLQANRTVCTAGAGYPQQSLASNTDAGQAACLLHVSDPELLAEMEATAAAVKKKVYDNRIVTFAPLSASNKCVNDCVYCGFRRSNRQARRSQLTLDQVKEETEVLAGRIGHKRLIVVYGEHPATGADYIASTIETIYSVQVKTKMGHGRIRRCNVNAAPMSVEDLRVLKGVGIGTFQVFQETYHRPTYEAVHPQDTIRAITCGGCTRCIVRWRPGLTTSGLARCSGFTTGGSR